MRAVIKGSMKAMNGFPAMEVDVLSRCSLVDGTKLSSFRAQRSAESAKKSPANGKHGANAFFLPAKGNMVHWCKRFYPPGEDNGYEHGQRQGRI